MIREARAEDRREIFELWKSAYPNQNQSYLTFYFRVLFEQGTCLVQEQDDRIISSLQLNEHILSFQERMLSVSYLLGISTLPDYRRRGHMRQLMESALDEAGHRHMITLIKAFNPKLYAPYGFDTVYVHKNYLIKSQDLQKVSTLHTQKEATAAQLLHAYQRFTSRFDGYYVRDKVYYEYLLEELNLREKQIIVYRDPVQGIVGYLIYKVVKDEILVKEAIYMESIQLMRMLKAISQQDKELIVEVSDKEKLEKIFPMAIPKRQGFMMARINDYELFNKYFNTDVKNPKEAYAILKKPLWLHEYY